jgi:hypothetical protein
MNEQEMVYGGGLIRNITVCCLPDGVLPFVHGCIDTADGPRDVWLRNDGIWTTREDDERNSLRLSDGFAIPSKTG